MPSCRRRFGFGTETSKNHQATRTSFPSFPFIAFLSWPNTICLYYKHSRALSNMSFESDRQHLLSKPVVSPPHSSAASFVSAAAVTNPDDRQISPSQSTADLSDTASTLVPTETAYRGFPSKADYLAALRAWAEEKQYHQFDTALIGWYGTKTKADYLNKPGLELRTKSKARKEEKRRATVSDASGSSHSAAAAPKSKQSAFRWPRRATLSKLTSSTTR